MRRIKYFKLYAPEGSESGNTEDILTEDNKELEDLRSNALRSEEEPEETPAEEPETEEPAEPDVQEEDKTEPEQSEEQADSSKIGEPIRVDDEYINQQPDDVKEFLNGVKGEYFSQKALKNYVNAQKYIKEQKTVKPEAEDKPSTFEKKQVKTLDNDQLAVAQNNYVFRQLQNKYPGLTAEMLTDEQKWNDYYFQIQDEESNPRKAHQFYEDYKAAVSNANDTVSKYKDLAQNWEAKASDTISNQYDEFEKKISELGVKLEDIGITKDDDFIINQVIYGKDGNPDPQVVTMAFGNIPVINKDGFYNKLMTIGVPKLYETARKSGKLEVLDHRNKNKSNPSISNSDIQSKADAKPALQKFDENTTLPEMESDLAALRKKIMSK